MATLTTLTQLTLDRSDLSEAGLRRLCTLIDDGAVKHLKLMSCLRILNLCGTKVSASGIEKLRETLPKCLIFWDGRAVIPSAAPPAGSVKPSSP